MQGFLFDKVGGLRPILLKGEFLKEFGKEFGKKGVVRNFAKFTGKPLCLRPATLLKKRLWHRSFPMSFLKFLRPPFFIEQLCWLLLTIKGLKG